VYCFSSDEAERMPNSLSRLGSARAAHTRRACDAFTSWAPPKTGKARRCVRAVIGRRDVVLYAK
jgi:hypothetical protein